MTACWGQAESNAAPRGPGTSPGAVAYAVKRNARSVTPTSGCAYFWVPANKAIVVRDGLTRHESEPQRDVRGNVVLASRATPCQTSGPTGFQRSCSHSIPGA
jgi:hypothetical protein